MPIAVSGHRQLSDPDGLETGIAEAAERIRSAWPGHSFEVFSCLAEGADRLLARRLLELLPARLTAILPIVENEYMKDFPTSQSQAEYKELCKLAEKVIQLVPGLSRPQAYREANRYLVENCKLLATIWDGKSARGPGGTGELVTLARQADLPMLWIHPGGNGSKSTLTGERLDKLLIENSPR